MDSLSKDDILKAYPHFNLTEMGRLKCSLTGHEIKDNLEDLKKYITTRKFKRALEVDQIKKEYGEYLGIIEGSDRLYCKVTLRDIESDPNSLRKHFNGKRFKRKLPAYLEKREKGFPMDDEFDSGEESGMDSDASSLDEDSYEDRTKLCTMEIDEEENETKKELSKKASKRSRVDLVFEDIADSDDDDEEEEEEEETESQKVTKITKKLKNMKNEKKKIVPAKKVKKN
uniref:Surfeit locus protein 2 n=1 Tax=Parastrongyloides trichosuri TaxID=131310 RepID=A0A0N4Z8U6_PARTI